MAPFTKIALVLIVLLATGCGGDPESPEAKIRAIIQQMVEAAEARSVNNLSEFISKTYKDQYHQNKAATSRSLLGYFHRHQSIYLLHQVKLIDVKTDRARAIVYVAMAGVPIESTQALLSIKADLYRFELDFAEEEGGWLVISAQWSKAQMMHFDAQ